MKKITFVFALLFLFLANPLFCQYYATATIGNTYYDLQTWRAMQKRSYSFADGTIGSVWVRAESWPGFNDKGIGYSYYDGSQWNEIPFPETSITSGWASFPSYSAFGENGEICFSQGTNKLIISSRQEKGTGEWDESYFTGTGQKHPDIVTTGTNHSVINLLYLSPDGSFNGTNAQPARGAIKYARSGDGGQTWDIDMEVPGLGSAEYLGFTIGSYSWAEPQNGVLAFVAGDYLTDLILMKSIDGGETWQKTIIWEHPYPMFEIFTFESDTFYCNDGGISVALDSDGDANVSFTLSRVYSTIVQDTIWYDPEIGGVVYWNEERDIFSNNINALNPYGHPESELEEDYSLIGWPQDIDNNGEIDLGENYGVYPTPGLCTMPQIVLNSYNQIVVLFSLANENIGGETNSFRHIWARNSGNSGDSWGDFLDLNQDLIYIFSECIYPSVLQQYIDLEYIYLSFQKDGQPGLSYPALPYYPENDIVFLSEYIGMSPTTVTANFIADTTLIHIGDTVHFTNLSSGNPPNLISFDWWFEGGSPNVSNDTNPAIVYTSQGIFDVKLTASISTISSHELLIEDYITVLPLTNINEPATNDKINIYPNPGNGKFILELNNYESQTIEYSVYNLLGVIVAKQRVFVEKPTVILDLKTEPEGVYFISIKTETGSQTSKLIIRE